MERCRVWASSCVEILCGHHFAARQVQPAQGGAAVGEGAGGRPGEAEGGAALGRDGLEAARGKWEEGGEGRIVWGGWGGEA